MKVKFFKLGTLIKDTVTGTSGMLVMHCIDIDRNTTYVYQPSALNPKTGAPVDRIQLHSKRIEGGILVEVDLPLNILNTKARDKATGFEGTIVGLDYHLSGCIHLDVKPEGTLPESGNTIDVQSFDIRRLEGPSLKSFDEKKLRESLVDSPSPGSDFVKSHKV